MIISEQLDDNSLRRFRVPGGWLVTCKNDYGHSGITFYPDPDHVWDGNSYSYNENGELVSDGE